MEKKKRIYWYLWDLTQVYKEKIAALDRAGFAVEICLNLDDLRLAIQRNRVGVILIGDNFREEGSVFSQIKFIASMQELGGVRFVLTPERFYPSVLNLAACSSFRDIIPMALSDTAWIERFLFSTAGAPINMGVPLGQVSTLEPCEVIAPARLAWLSHNELRVECKLEPRPGQLIKISGPMVKAMGANYLKFVVKNVEKQNLVYRFSRAITGSYHADIMEMNKFQEVLGLLKDASFRTRCKVFTAITSGKLRSEILGQLESHQFDVTVALHKHSISSDPLYFCPNIIIVDDKICQSPHLPEFEGLLEIMNHEVPIVIIGRNIDAINMQKKYPQHNFFFEPTIPFELGTLIFKKYLGKSFGVLDDQNSQKYFVYPEHDFSFLNLTYAGKLTQVHPLNIRISSGIKILPFSLCQIKAPILSLSTNKELYIKVTESLVHPWPAVNDQVLDDEYQGYLCTTTTVENKKIAAVIYDYFTEKLAAFLEIRDDKTPLTKQVEAKATDSYHEEELSHTLIQWPVVKGKIQEVWNKNDFQTFKYFMIFIVITGLAIGLIWGISSSIAPYYDKSGKEFTRELEKFRDYFGH